MYILNMDLNTAVDGVLARNINFKEVVKKNGKGIMLSFRLFTILLVFSLFSRAESDDQGVPCEDGEPTPTGSSTTNPLPTTKPRLCRDSAYTAFKRKNGYWCGQLYGLAVAGSQPYSGAVNDCSYNDDVLSSIETEEELAHYRKDARLFSLNNITAIWMGASYNDSAQKWYWSDGQAIPTMEPQPTVVSPGGQVAWFLYEGDKVLKVSNTSIRSNVWVNGYVCGHPSPVSVL
uniref:C-type lectin domain-containing protein n=1 Tax=Caenorhabditis tropicalis TaxID=1561998 RepID=A0A1I7V473_9PELO